MSKTSISSEVGWGLVKAYTTENPRPSTRQLAKRFGVSSASVQRYLKKTLALVIQPTQNEVEARMRVELAPAAIHEVNMLTKDHVLTKMRKVLGEAEGQYELLKESNPTLAGAYLREMRQTIETMGKWARIDQGEDKSPAVGVQVDHAADGRCQGCSRESWTSREVFENGLRESAAYFESIEPLYCKECPLRYPEKYPDTGSDRLKAYFQLLEHEKEIPPWQAGILPTQRAARKASVPR